MKQIGVSLISLVIGLIFGAGLVISGMIDTSNVKGFLDITGDWRPALAFVMGAALLVSLPAFQWAKRRGEPLVAGELESPPQIITLRLVVGAAIFGIGWGLSGICPGPAIVWLGIRPLEIAPFVLAVIVGAWLADQVRAKAG